MPDEPSPWGKFDAWWRVGSTVIAPATLLSALLFYFGYVSSRAQYRYFGLDVDTVGLTTRDYVMRSPQALLVPLLALSLGAAVLLALHLVIRRHPLPVAAVRVGLATALLALLAGVGLIAAYPLFGEWAYYPLATPLLLAGGVAGTAYLLRRPGAPPLLEDGDGQTAGLRSGVVVLAVVTIVTCLFWATATIAEWSGRGTAMRTARHLDELPSVVLDTRERLFLTDGIVEEVVLPTPDGEDPRYRYRRLRLLIQGDKTLFLVPDTWTARDSTLMVPLDGDVRVQFRFVNRAP